MLDMTGKPWTYAELKMITKLVREKTPVKTIAATLGRTKEEVRAKMDDLNIPQKR